MSLASIGAITGCLALLWNIVSWVMSRPRVRISECGWVRSADRQHPSGLVIEARIRNKGLAPATVETAGFAPGVPAPWGRLLPRRLDIRLGNPRPYILEVWDPDRDFPAEISGHGAPLVLRAEYPDVMYMGGDPSDGPYEGPIRLVARLGNGKRKIGPRLNTYP